MKKKICIFTGSRADYGILKFLIKDLKNKKFCDAKVFVGGSHFIKNFGYTFNEIKKDKIKINYKSKIKLKNTDNIDILKFISLSINEYSLTLKKLRPDLVIVLGDRFETFAFVIACYFLNINIAHIHGGELTSGSFDDNIRHSISKLSNFHFVTHNKYKKRLIQMGENKKNIFNVGSLGVQNYFNTKKLTKINLFSRFNIPQDKKKVLVTFHPETRSNISYKNQINIFLSSLSSLNNIYFIFTFNNTDTSGLYFLNQLKKFVKQNKNSMLFNSMGSELYYSFLKNVDLVVGNSSSGIIEAPSAKTLTLNVGKRQFGRILSNSIFNSKLNKVEIKKSILKLLKIKLKKYNNVYYKKNSKEKIISVIKSKIKKKSSEIKEFFDIKFYDR